MSENSLQSHQKLQSKSSGQTLNNCLGEIDFAVLRYERDGSQNLIIRGWITNDDDPITTLQLGIPGCRLSFARWIERFDLPHAHTKNFFSYGFQAALAKNDLIADLQSIYYVAILKSGLSKVGMLPLPDVRIQKIPKDQTHDHQRDIALVDTQHENIDYSSIKNISSDAHKKIPPSDINNTLRMNHIAHWEDRLKGFLLTNTVYELPYCEKPSVSIIIPVHNMACLTYACLSSILSSTYTNYELIVVDNCSNDQTSELLRKFKGIKVIRTEENLHYLKGINLGTKHAIGTYLLFLNNDTVIDPSAIAASLKTFIETPHTGAVGGKIVSFDGKLQEAGSMLLKDGSSYAYGVGEDPWDYKYLFERAVDYCSGCFFMTPRNLFLELGGFDERYAPAYYEEVDYCIRLKKAGLNTIYQPRSIIFHLGHGSAGSQEVITLQTKNRQVLCEIHSQDLSHAPTLFESVIRFGRSAKDKRKRVLFIDDRIPFLEAGAGFPRTHTILTQFSQINADVSFFPTKLSSASYNEIYDTIPKNIEIVPGEDENSLLEHIKLRFNFYDYIFISRPHNLEIWNKIKNKINLERLKSKLIYDAESIFSDREIHTLQYTGKSKLNEDEKSFVVSKELELAKDFHHITTVCNRDLRVVEKHGFTSSSILSYGTQIFNSTRSFYDRKDILFVGPLLQKYSPNVDGMNWFLEEVFPKVKIKLSEIINLNIIGIKNPHALKNVHAATHLGPVTSVAPFYDIHRLVIAPIRITAGISIKTIEAAAHGIPVVCTGQIAKLMEWENEENIFYSDDSETYAEIIAECYRNIEVWNKIREWQINKIKNEFNEQKFKTEILKILSL